MNMSLSELSRCFEILSGLLKDRGLTEVNTGDRDFYWTISADEALHFEKEPEVVVGSLDDDLDELRRLLQADSEATLVDLERMAAVWRLLAYQLSEQEPTDD